MKTLVKKLLTLIMLAMVSVTTSVAIIGCGEDSEVEEAAESVEESAEDAADEIEDQM